MNIFLLTAGIWILPMPAAMTGSARSYVYRMYDISRKSM